MRPAWGTLLEDIELVPQDQDFRFQPPSRLEVVAQHAEEQEADCKHRRSCSDSQTPSQLDRVFGSDTVSGWRFFNASSTREANR
jgi:hypothetical protein